MVIPDRAIADLGEIPSCCLAYLIFDYCYSLLALLAENVVQKGGFSRAQEPSDLQKEN
jgi:hypothetical protein